MPAERQDIGPDKINFTTLSLKILAGIGGGAAGTLILILIATLASSVLGSLFASSEIGQTVTPISLFLVMIMVFVASTASNILSILLLAFTEKEKYQRKATAVYQVFIMSLLMFLLMVPVYFLTLSGGIEYIAYAVALHILISAQVSALILEIISNYRYTLLGLYGVTFATVLAAGILFVLSGSLGSPAVILFTALPVIWGCIALMHSLTTMLYGSVARIYDKDFLATDNFYGEDYGKKTIEKKPAPTTKTKDSAGAEFLRRK